MGGFIAPKPPKPVVQPTKNDDAVAEAARQRKLQTLQGGRAATVLTSATGDTSTASTQKATLGRG
jgi:hypothetical protein